MKSILLMITLFTSYISYCQGFEKIYMGKDYNFYLGSEITLDSTALSLNNMIYAKREDIDGLYPKNVYSPREDYSFSTKTESLLGKVFKVDTIENHDPYRVKIFKLIEINTNEELFLLYTPKRSTSRIGFPFLTKKQFKKEDFCSKIKIDKDDFTDKVDYATPFEKDGTSNIRISKVVEGDEVFFYLYLTTIGSTANVGIEGVILLLDDKTKIEKPSTEIDVDVSKYGYNYSALLSLNKEEIEILKNKEIDKFRLYIYDKDLSSGMSKKIKMYMQCLSE